MNRKTSVISAPKHYRQLYCSKYIIERDLKLDFNKKVESKTFYQKKKNR